MTGLPLTVYLALCGLGILSVYTIYKNRDKVYNDHVWFFAMILHGNVVAENMYYGLSRLSEEMYSLFSWFWPAVLVFKVIYAISFAGILFAFMQDKK